MRFKLPAMNAPRIPPRPLAVTSDPAQQLGSSATQRAQWVLALGQLSRALWPVVLLVKLGLILALSGWLPLLGPWGHAGVLAGYAVMMALAANYAVTHYQRPNPTLARRAVEKASALPHRPLTTLADTPIGNARLWERHRRAAAALIRQTPLRLPHLSLAMGGRLWQVGSLLSWLLVIGLLAYVGSDTPLRLREAVYPQLGQLVPSPHVDAFITPPAYSGLPPQTLPDNPAVVSVLPGSQISLRVNGGLFPPVLDLPERSLRLTREDNASYAYTAPLASEGPLVLRQDGRRLGRWQIRLIADAPPEIDFTEPPQASEQKTTRIAYTASDDVGLERITLRIEPVIVSVTSAHGQPMELTLPLSEKFSRQAKGFRFFDLTAHPLAGSDVLLTLIATDSHGQSRESMPVRYTLPERVFTHPIARALINLRKELLVRGPAMRDDGRDVLRQLGQTVFTAPDYDPVGVLALHVIGLRFALGSAFADATSEQVMEKLMWETALHFEDGGTTASLNALREAQQALEDALANNASSAELRQLMQQLAQTMADYLDHLQQQGQGEEAQNPSGDSISREDVEALLNQLQQMAQSGAHDQARQLLQQLQQLMENLQPHGQPGRPDPEFERDLQKLNDLSDQQQDMMRSQPQDEQTPSGEQDAKQQDQLRRDLGDIMQNMAERDLDISKLGKGEREMSAARDALRQSEREQAAGHQGRALQHLREGLEDLRQQAQQRRQAGGATDPLGRSRGAGDPDTGTVKIPDADDLSRARQLLEELRHRSENPDLPAPERDYIDRLIKLY